MKHAIFALLFLSILCGGLVVTHYTGLYDLQSLMNKKSTPAMVAGSVQLDATPQDIKTSLGPPRFVTARMEENILIEIWGYHFENDARPTLIELIDGKLTNAYRSSYASIDAEYGRMPFQTATP